MPEVARLTGAMRAAGNGIANHRMLTHSFTRRRVSWSGDSARWAVFCMQCIKLCGSYKMLKSVQYCAKSLHVADVAVKAVVSAFYFHEEP